MNYDISFRERNRLVLQTNLKPYRISLEEMRKSATEVKSKEEYKTDINRNVYE